MNKPETRVCVSVCEETLNALQNASERAAEWANLIELRLDCLDAGAESQIPDNFSKPVILTFRPSEEGGRRELSRDQRLAFWKTLTSRENVWWDLESDLVHDLSPDWSRAIVSHHDFNNVPDDLVQIYERMVQTPARVVKLAAQANDVVDCLPLFQLIDRARNEGREIIAIAMGNAGVATRILGPSRGAFLTYAALNEDSTTAPGQVTARSLRSLYHIDSIDSETMIAGLVGLPVMHSLSPHIHNAAFGAEGINGVYLPFEVKDVTTFFKRMVHPRTREFDWKLRGLSVTAPHKQAVMNSVDWIEPNAKDIGAVNTVIVEDEHLFGYNTDAEGLVEPLLKSLGPLGGKKVAIIGAGGAARAAIWALRREGAEVTIFARNVGKARPLAKLFDVGCRSLPDAVFSGYEVVINATPLGSGEFIDQSPVTEEQFAGVHCAYDLIYNPRETKFLREARKAGCKTFYGLEMLVAQARLQFELWTGRRVSSSVMYDAGANVLSS